MSSYFSNNLRILVAKIEGTPGGGQTITPVDFDVRVRNPVVTPTIEVDDEASKYASGDHGEDESIMGAQSASIEFQVKMSTCEISATMDEGDCPPWWKFAEACGCKKVLYRNSTSVIGCALQPRKEYDLKTMTICIYDFPRNYDSSTSAQALQYTFEGCMGKMTIGAEGVGKPWTASFSFTGKLKNIEMVDKSDVPGITIEDGTIAEKMINYQLKFGSEFKKISTFKLDTGNEVSPLIDQSDPTGYAYYSITKRSPRFSCNPLADSTFVDTFQRWKNEQTFPIELKSTNADSGFTLYVPKSQQISGGLANREGLINMDLNFKALRRRADEISGDGMTSSTDQEVTWELLVGKRVP